MPRQIKIKLSVDKFEPYRELADHLQVPVEDLLGRVLVRHAVDATGLHQEVTGLMSVSEQAFLRALPEAIVPQMRTALVLATLAYADEVFHDSISVTGHDVVDAILRPSSCAEAAAEEKFDEFWPFEISPEDRGRAIGMAISNGKVAAIRSTRWLRGDPTCPCCKSGLRPIPDPNPEESECEEESN